MVFKNEGVLLPEYLPATLPHREQQIKLIANNLIPLAKGRKSINTFVFGPPGIGKTAVVKHVLKEFEEHYGIKTIYLNCWDFNTSIAVLSQVAISLGIPVARRGWSKDEIFSRFLEAIKKAGAVVIALDEIDQLVRKSQDVLYDFLRSKLPLGLIFVSNDRYAFSRVEPRIRSSLQLDEIEFRPYSFLEMKDIVRQRVKEAFTAVEAGVVALVANKAVKEGGDVRVALEVLLKAGRIAEREGAKKLMVKHVKSVIVSNPKASIVYQQLSEVEKTIYDLLTEPMSTLELYEKVKKVNPISERSFRSFLDHLISSGVLEVVGMKNKARVVKRKMEL